MKLFTIGDSVSQGFVSGFAARTDLSYPTLIARAMGLGNEYKYPVWGAGGLPVNMERILRSLAEEYGSNVNPVEWLAALRTINEVMDDSEDYYEYGAGSEPYGGGIEFFHNVAFQGADVADAWLVTPEVCEEAIEEAGGENDLPFSGPNAAFHRTARRVLNPSHDPGYGSHSQLRWLEEHAAGDGVENLLLWLGANNALGTVVSLKVEQTPGDPNTPLLDMTHQERDARGWNLWHPRDFELEYTELLSRVDDIMRRNARDDWSVFVGTVPLVTIAPLAKGVGPTTRIKRNGVASVYYKYYTYFPFEEDDIRDEGVPYLTLQDALHIDDCIRAYNATIKRLVEEKNAELAVNEGASTARYHIVDTGEALRKLAFKRNAGDIEYDFPRYFEFVYPKVDTKYYHADTSGRLRQGGLFGLDGVHPSAIGQGLIAHEFLNVMQEAGIVADDANLDWPSIFASDELYSNPIPVMHELYNKDWLAKYLIKRFTRY